MKIRIICKNRFLERKRKEEKTMSGSEKGVGEQMNRSWVKREVLHKGIWRMEKQKVDLVVAWSEWLYEMRDMKGGAWEGNYHQKWGEDVMCSLE